MSHYIRLLNFFTLSNIPKKRLKVKKAKGYDVRFAVQFDFEIELQSLYPQYRNNTLFLKYINY